MVGADPEDDVAVLAVRIDQPPARVTQT
jgi:hypothetical protein